MLVVMIINMIFPSSTVARSLRKIIDRTMLIPITARIEIVVVMLVGSFTFKWYVIGDIWLFLRVMPTRNIKFLIICLITCRPSERRVVVYFLLLRFRSISWSLLTLVVLSICGCCIERGTFIIWLKTQLSCSLKWHVIFEITVFILTFSIEGNIARGVFLFSSSIWSIPFLGSVIRLCCRLH